MTVRPFREAPQPSLTGVRNAEVTLMHLLECAPLVLRTLGAHTVFFAMTYADATPRAWMNKQPTRVDAEGYCIALEEELEALIAWEKAQGVEP